MDNIYMLADAAIMSKIGGRLKGARLRQNVTQQSLAASAGVSVSSLKKIEKGEIGSFETLLRVLRTLGELEVLQPVVEEEQLSPSEYYQMVQSNAATHRRRRAAGRLSNNSRTNGSEW